MSSPWNDLLPKSLEINGREYEIRSDYRAMLDIMIACDDPELDDYERADAVLTIFYPAFSEMPPEDYQEAINKCFWFMNGGKEGKKETKRKPRLVDWEKDFPLIVAPVNRIVGQEIRAVEYMHWWTFLAAFNEVGECLWQQVVKIRSYKAKGKPLDKSDKAWYNENKDLVDLPTRKATTDVTGMSLSEYLNL